MIRMPKPAVIATSPIDACKKDREKARFLPASIICGPTDMADTEVQRLAAILLYKFGDAAEQFACNKADEAFNRGNDRAYDQWSSIALAVCELEETGAMGWLH